MYYMSSQNPERACQSFLNVKIWHLYHQKWLKMERGMFMIKTANQIWSTCESQGVWDECLTCSCDGQLWVHLSASKRNTWCESRRVTRDARVVARDAFKRARQHLWPMSLLCVVETRPLWRHTFLTSSHISWQISQMRKWRGESDISKCNFHAMRQKKRISGVVRPGAMNLLLVIVHVRFMSMSGRHKFHGLSPSMSDDQFPYVKCVFGEPPGKLRKEGNF